VGAAPTGMRGMSREPIWWSEATQAVWDFQSPAAVRASRAPHFLIATYVALANPPGSDDAAPSREHLRGEVWLNLPGTKAHWATPEDVLARTKRPTWGVRSPSPANERRMARFGATGRSGVGAVTQRCRRGLFTILQRSPAIACSMDLGS
jgi:hypothetical protein